MKDFNLLGENFRVVLKIMCHAWIISEVEKEITYLTQGCLVVIIMTVENYENHGNSLNCGGRC